jgi:hypothetical protein
MLMFYLMTEKGQQMKKYLAIFLILSFSVLSLYSSQKEILNVGVHLKSFFSINSNEQASKNLISPDAFNNKLIQRYSSEGGGKVAGFRAMGIIGSVLMAVGVIAGIVAIGLTLWIYINIAMGVTVIALTLGLAGSKAFGSMGVVLYTAMGLGIAAGALFIIGLPLCVVGFVLASYFEKKVSLFFESDKNLPVMNTGIAIKI